VVELHDHERLRVAHTRSLSSLREAPEVMFEAEPLAFLRATWWSSGVQAPCHDPVGLPENGEALICVRPLHLLRLKRRVSTMEGAVMRRWMERRSEAVGAERYQDGDSPLLPLVLPLGQTARLPAMHPCISISAEEVGAPE
jgi:hypothetical protein